MAKKNRIRPLSKAATQETLLHRMTNRIRQSLELQEILSATVAEIRSFLDTDRVKVYRFQPDATGQVIAESVAHNRLPSLLNQHFPAGDIPPHAREMFVKARVRSIIDIPTQRITLNRLDCLETTGDLTVEDVQNQAIEDILQRPVDPCHVEYLTTMGVQSSLVIPILHQQNLWGLLASHHSQPKVFSQQQLQMVQILADQVAIAISQSQLLSQARERSRQQTLINQISTLLHSPLKIQEILQIALACWQCRFCITISAWES
jgi:light-regulated signal transduction histidine kinase (bacteriophytochrome)